VHEIDLARPDGGDLLLLQEERVDGGDSVLDLELGDAAADARHLLGAQTPKDRRDQVDDELARDSRRGVAVPHGDTEAPIE
jgi:hypothetical protein